MKELDTLRRQARDRAKAIATHSEKIRVEEAVVAKGGSGRELRLLEQDRADEVARLEPLQRRIAVLEAEEARALAVTTLLERARQAEEAQDQQDATWVDVHDEIDRALSRLYATLQRCRAVVNDFHHDASHLAPIYAPTNPGRQEADALREELVARGATLRAVGVRHHTGQSCVFEGAGGLVHAPRPERWSWLIQMALDGLDREQAMIAERQEREERERKVKMMIGGAA